MPSGRSASITALATAGSDPVQPDSPTPLTPSGLTLLGVGCSAPLMPRQQPGARHVVVHEAAGEQLPRVAIVNHFLAEHLPRPLRDAAVELALDDGMIDHRADVVHRGSMRRSPSAPVSGSISTSAMWQPLG